MDNITLDSRDRDLLEELRRGRTTVEDLAAELDRSEASLRDRLPPLADNGLVREVDDAYELAESGLRVLNASPAGNLDDRIDTPGAVERALAEFDLRPDREEAVRNAFTFLHYWGEATEGEIKNGVYSENPATYESADEWWDRCVRDRLAALPDVESPDTDGQPWRYAGTAMIDGFTEDGRQRFNVHTTFETYGSVKHALEDLELSEEERAAVRAAFEILRTESELTEGELRERAYRERPAGDESADEWWDRCVRDALVALPGVERSDSGDETWRYVQTAEGPMSSDAGSQTETGPGDGEAEPDEEEG